MRIPTSSGFFLFIFCIAFLASCKSVYHPNVVNTPLLSNQGELRAYADPGNVQLAYAATDHLGLMANGFYVAERSNDNNIKGSGGLVEAGFGYFTTFGALRFETYVGGGRGGVTFTEQKMENGMPVTREFSAAGTRFFIQPSIGFAGRYIELAVTPRFIAGKYDGIQTNYTAQEQIDGRFYQIDKPVWTFIEPAFTVRGGYKWIKLQAQFGFSAKLNSQPLSYKSSFMSVGIIFDIFREYE